MFRRILIGGSFAILVAAGLGIGIYSLLDETDESVSPAESEPTLVADQVDDSIQVEESPASSEQTANTEIIDIGEPWQASGIVAGLDDFGLILSTEAQEDIYIELGPPEYWQSQGVTLEIGQKVTVQGLDNEGQIHAVQVALEDGQILAIRTEDGQPLWSGGPTDNQQDGDHEAEPKVQVDEWVTVSGTITAMRGANITIVTAEDEVITFQAGQPRFFESQGVPLSIGETVEVLGFWEGTGFTAGQITQTATGDIIMLRDPNGRPLWAGPGNGDK